MSHRRPQFPATADSGMPAPCLGSPMARRADGNPQHGASDHAGLASLLDESDLALARRPTATDDPFDLDPDADSRETFPLGVASGGPTPQGVIL